MKKIVLLTFVLALLLSSCNQSQPPVTPTVDTIAEAIAQTMTVQNAVQNQVAQTMAVQYAVQTLVAQTQSVPPTFTPTLVPIVLARANKNANCRSGPAANFDLLGVLSAGESANVIGRNQVFGDWWKVELADGIQCWVINEAVTLEGDIKSIANLISPNTPTPVPNVTLTIINHNNSTIKFYLDGIFVTDIGSGQTFSKSVARGSHIFQACTIGEGYTNSTCMASQTINLTSLTYTYNIN